MDLTLLSRACCHLCDEMLEALRPIAAAAGATIEVIDVDAATNAALDAAWGDKVPVLFAGDPGTGVVLCHYRLDRAQVVAVLASAGRARD
jgi:thioredoxin reductase (NADPH)